MELGKKPASLPINKVPTAREMATATAISQRRNPIQEALDYQEHLEASSTGTYKEVAAHFGVTGARVCQMLALLKKLPRVILDEFLDAADQGAMAHITERSLRPLTRMDSDEAKVSKFMEMKMGGVPPCCRSERIA